MQAPLLYDWYRSTPSDGEGDTQGCSSGQRCCWAYVSMRHAQPVDTAQQQHLTQQPHDHVCGPWLLRESGIPGPHLRLKMMCHTHRPFQLRHWLLLQGAPHKGRSAQGTGLSWCSTQLVQSTHGCKVTRHSFCKPTHAPTCGRSGSKKSSGTHSGMLSLSCWVTT